MDNPKVIAVLSIKKCKEDDESQECELCYCEGSYNQFIFLNLYNQDLKYLPYFKIGLYFIHFYEYIELSEENEEGEESNVFCKFLYITILNKPCIFFIFVEYEDIVFEIIETNIVNYINNMEIILYSQNCYHFYDEEN